MNCEIQINPKDNVVVSLCDGEGRRRGHKYAKMKIGNGEAVVKYGEIIGYATDDIQAGDHVHTHNVKTGLGDIVDYEYKPVKHNVDIRGCDKSVKVYERYNGEIGIRNELWVVPTVGCVNGNAREIVELVKKKLVDKGMDMDKIPYLDGIQTFGHPYGCSQMGEDHENTRKSLQNIVKNPNAGGVLILGLGCENNQIEAFMETMGDYDKNRIRTLVAQDFGDEVEEGARLLLELLENMSGDERVEKPIGVLNVGLECGGSDGLSGVTANPLLGRFSDYLINCGGTTVLTEVPEMFGAEIPLMNRCVDEKVFNKAVDMINGFKNYYKAHNQVIYDNPSPGNKKGGITTLEDKSLGCTTKSGQSQVVDVLESTERLKKKGLNLLSAPGNDAVATTVLGMSGCHMVLFTTGRGTPFGGFIPTVKVATNHELAEKKKRWIDFDAGKLILGTSMDDLLEEFINLVIRVAEGEDTKQETNRFREIAIFKSGVIL